MAYNANEVIPGLWQGRAPSDSDVRGRFDVVVLSAFEWQPALNVRSVLRVPLDDGLISKREKQMALHASAVVAEALKQGAKVLVTCHMGLNRSGLISALALMRLGSSAGQAIAAVRRARGDSALHNMSFVEFLNASPLG